MALWIGTIGVALLLLAFALNIVGRLPENSRIYLLMNVIGALLAAWYAYKGNVIPFVVLELVWALSALVRLVLVIEKGSRN